MTLTGLVLINLITDEWKDCFLRYVLKSPHLPLSSCPYSHGEHTYFLQLNTQDPWQNSIMNSTSNHLQATLIIPLIQDIHNKKKFNFLHFIKDFLNPT